jgi:hypothetical protein
MKIGLHPEAWDEKGNPSRIQESYQAWLDSLPENLTESATAETLRTICEIDLSELESVEPLRGFGRD